MTSWWRHILLWRNINLPYYKNDQVHAKSDYILSKLWHCSAAVRPWKVQRILTKFGTAIEGRGTHKISKNREWKFFVTRLNNFGTFDPNFSKKCPLEIFEILG